MGTEWFDNGKLERSYSEVLKCSKSVKDRLMVDCVREFLRHHPEFANSKITHCFMLDRVTRHYLDRPPFDPHLSVWGKLKKFVSESYDLLFS